MHFVFLSFPVFSAGISNGNVVIFPQNTAPQKESLSDFESKEILQNLQFNGIDTSVFEWIRNKAKTHYIPIDIILQLRRMSHLNPEELTFKEIMQESGYDIKELSDKEITSIRSYLMHLNESP